MTHNHKSGSEKSRLELTYKQFKSNMEYNLEKEFIEIEIYTLLCKFFKKMFNLILRKYKIVKTLMDKIKIDYFFSN